MQEPRGGGQGRGTTAGAVAAQSCAVDGGVEVIADTNVPLDPNVHQAIAMVESEDVAAGNVLAVMQKGYTLNGRTIRAAMVTVAKAK